LIVSQRTTVVVMEQPMFRLGTRTRPTTPASTGDAAIARGERQGDHGKHGQPGAP